VFLFKSDKSFSAYIPKALSSIRTSALSLKQSLHISWLLIMKEDILFNLFPKGLLEFK